MGCFYKEENNETMSNSSVITNNNASISMDRVMNPFIAVNQTKKQKKPSLTIYMTYSAKRMITYIENKNIMNKDNTANARLCKFDKRELTRFSLKFIEQLKDVDL
jgi:hypothetical protein